MKAGNQDSGELLRRPAARTMRRAFFIVGVAVMAAWGGWFASRALVSPAPGAKNEEKTVTVVEPETETNLDSGWRSQPGYAGSRACGKCHADQFETYLETAHSRALTEVVPEQEPADGAFDHEPSGRRYRTTRRDGRMMHEESLLLGDGSEFAQASMPLRYRVGSGHFGRTYLCDGGGDFLVESPLTWYEPTHMWGMSPGYDNPRHQSFRSRAWFPRAVSFVMSGMSRRAFPATSG